MATKPLTFLPLQRDVDAESKMFPGVSMEECDTHPLTLAMKARGTSVSGVATPTSSSAPTPINPKTTMTVDPLAGNPLGGDPLGDDPLGDDPLGGGDPLGGNPLGGASGAPVVITTSAGTTTVSSGISAMAGVAGALMGDGTVGGDDDEGEGFKMFEQWVSREPQIIERFRTSQSIPILTHLISLNEEGLENGVAVDKTRERLDQLERLDAKRGEGGAAAAERLTQSEYLTRIEGMNDEIIDAWGGGARVRAVRTTVQLAMLLSTTPVPAFFPSQFVLIARVLDAFCKLVFERLLTRANEFSRFGTLTADCDVRQIPPEAVETARNWFQKTSLIRELVPRLFMDMALLPSRRFHTSGKESTEGVLSRLSRQINGITNQLAGAYACVYLVRKGVDVGADHTRPDSYLVECVAYMKRLACRLHKMEPAQVSAVAPGLSRGEYMELYEPTFEWIFYNYLYLSGADATMELWDWVQTNTPSLSFLYGILLKIGNFQPLAAKCVEVSDAIKSCPGENGGMDKALLFTRLGKVMSRSVRNIKVPTRDGVGFLTHVWDVIQEISDVAQYLDIAAAYMPFVLKVCGTRYANTLLGDVQKRVAALPDSTEYSDAMVAVVRGLFLNVGDAETLFSLSHFMPLLDLFKGAPRADVARLCLGVFANTTTTTDDPLIISAAFDLGRVAYESLGYESTRDEKRETAQLIVAFIRQVHYGQDVETWLSFLTDCSMTFGALDPVLVQLVHSALSLAMLARKVVGGSHSRKTRAYVQACLAFAFITAPSVRNLSHRIQLYYAGASVATSNGCHAQADSFAKSAVQLVMEVPCGVEEDADVAFLVGSLLSVLYFVPGHPEHGPFYLLRGLNTVLQKRQWTGRPVAQAKIAVTTVSVLAGMAQSRFTTRIPGVSSNDQLYCGDPEYDGEVAELLLGAVKDLDSHLTTLATDGDPGTRRTAARLALRVLHLLPDVSTPNSEWEKLLIRVDKFVRASGERAVLTSRISAIERLKEIKVSVDAAIVGTHSHPTTPLAATVSRYVLDGDSETAGAILKSLVSIISRLEAKTATVVA